MDQAEAAAARQHTGASTGKAEHSEGNKVMTPFASTNPNL
jgi:hypothetical protein